MGRVFLKFIDNTSGQVYTCKYCGTHLADPTDVISKAFTGKTGTAYLMESV